MAVRFEPIVSDEFVIQRLVIAGIDDRDPEHFHWEMG
jgi:hypothetical protein